MTALRDMMHDTIYETIKEEIEQCQLKGWDLYARN